MPSSTRKQAARSLVLASLVVLSVLAHASVASATGPPEEDVVDVPGVDGELGVWKYSALTLRADTDEADMTLDNAGWVVSYDSPETSLKRDTIGVYDEGSEVSFDFDAGDGGDEENFANEDARVIRAHVVDDGDESVPTTRAEALDLLSESTANENVEFRVVTNELGLDGDGEASFSDKPHDSGHYFYFLTDAGSYTIEDGNFNAPSSGQSATILGMEHVVVRKGTGDVENDDKVKPGNSITFSTTPTEVSGDTVRQGVVLYDEEAYTSAMFGVDVSGELSEDSDPSEQSTLSSSIDEVNGVANLDSGVEAFGLTMEERRVARSGGLESLLSFVSTQAGVASPTYEDRSGNHVVLDASATATQGSNGEAELTVETLDDWSTGDYRWVYVAVGENSQDMVTDTGTVTVKKQSTDGGDTDPDDGKDGDNGDDGKDDDDGKDGDNGDDGNDGSSGGGGGAPGAPGDGDDSDSDAGDGDDGDDGDDTDDPEPASISITDATLSASEITAGESVDVSVTLTNGGDEDGTKTVRVRADDETVATEQITVEGGETIEETISVTFDEPGTYDISVSGTSAGTLTVTEESSPGGAEPPEDGGGLPLVTVGIVVVISGLAGALYFFRIK